MTSTPVTQPILIELGQNAWDDYLDSVESWLGNVLLAQTTFRKFAEDLVGKIHDPRIDEQIICIRDSARDHEQKIGDLYRLIGRSPASPPSITSTVMSKARQALADLEGMMGGAAGPWHDLRQLLLANLNAIGAFATAEQLGLALGLPDFTKLAFEIVRDKSTEQLVIQEYVLEMSPISILYKSSI